MHFERQMPFKMHKIIFFNLRKNCVPTYLKFSDTLPETNFFIWPNVKPLKPYSRTVQGQQFHHKTSQTAGQSSLIKTER